MTVPQVSRATQPFTDEPVAGPCETHAILPAQFFPKSSSVRTGEQRLMVAVLEDAITLHFKRIPPGTTKLRPKFLREQGQADHWLQSDDRVSAFSFLRICEAVNLDPQYVRDGLRILHEETVTDGHHPRTWKGHRRPHSRRGSPGCALTTPVEHHSEERSVPTANGSSGAKARKQVSRRFAEMGSERSTTSTYAFGAAFRSLR